MTVACSIIIPTRDRADVLDACVASLTRQGAGRDRFEVIVVDNGTDDRTRAVADRYAGKLQLAYVRALEPGLHVGRHAGMRKARADLLVFGDDDIVAEPGWVESVLDAFAAPDVALVGGNNRPLFEATPPSWLVRMWERPVYRGRALPGLSILDFGEEPFDIDPHFVWGCNFAIRRGVLLEAGGFHPDAMPRDRIRWRGDGETHVSAFIARTRRRAVFHPGASVAHRVPAARMTAGYFAERSFAQGVSDSYTDLRRSGGGRVSWTHRIAREFRPVLQDLRRLAGTGGDAVAREVREIEAAMREGYRRGYDFHQSEVKNDPALRAWVGQEHYLA